MPCTMWFIDLKWQGLTQDLQTIHASMTSRVMLARKHSESTRFFNLMLHYVSYCSVVVSDTQLHRTPYHIIVRLDNILVGVYPSGAGSGGESQAVNISVYTLLVMLL